MPSAHRASARRPTHSGPRAGPLTHAQGRHFRTGVIEALRGMASHKFHGTVRAFATQLMERHGSQPPFESRARIEGRLRRLEREGVIRYDWTKSQAYEVVSTITLVTEDAVEPPRRKFTRRREVASEAEQVRRRMEILATLEHLGGNAESVRELARIVIREYGDGHRSGTVIVDLQSLEHTRSVEKRASRVHGRPTQHIALSGTGRRTLARYRDAHGGVPKPPAPTDIGAAAPAVAVPKSQRVGLSELSLAVLGEVALYSGAGRELAEIITALARVWNHPPKKGFAQTIRFRCRDLASSGYLKRLEAGKYQITEAGIQRIIASRAPAPAVPAAPAPTAAPMPAPAAPAASAAPTDGAAHPEPTDPLPDSVRAIDADIARVRSESQQLDAERAELEERIAGIDRRSAEVTSRLARIEHLRQAALEAYADPAPAKP